MDFTLFSRAALESLSGSERDVRLRSFESVAASALSGCATHETFFAVSREVVEELRAVGHDLWSFDSDGEVFETWCGDYSRVDGGGRLIVTFRYPRTVEAGWTMSGEAG